MKKSKVLSFLAVAALASLAVLSGHPAKASSILIGTIYLPDGGPQNNYAPQNNVVQNGTIVDGGQIILTPNSVIDVQCQAWSAGVSQFYNQPTSFCYALFSDGGNMPQAGGCYQGAIVPSSYVSANGPYPIAIGSRFTTLSVQTLGLDAGPGLGQCNIYQHVQPKGTGQAQ